MNKVSKIILVVFLAFLVSSCGTVTRMSTFAPNKVQLQINMSDLNYLGETEISVSYSSYLGLIKSIEEINGVQYNPSDVKIVAIEGLDLKFDNVINKAAYKVVEEYPKATYFQVVYKKTEKNRLFLGNSTKSSAVIRAYSYK